MTPEHTLPAPVPAPGTWYRHFGRMLGWVALVALPVLAWRQWGPPLEPLAPASFPWVRGVILYYTVLWIVSAAFVAHVAWQSLRDGSWPRPGAWAPHGVSRNRWLVYSNGVMLLAVAGVMLAMAVRVWITEPLPEAMGWVGPDCAATDDPCGLLRRPSTDADPAAPDPVRVP